MSFRRSWLTGCDAKRFFFSLGVRCRGVSLHSSAAKKQADGKVPVRSIALELRRPTVRFMLRERKRAKAREKDSQRARERDREREIDR